MLSVPWSTENTTHFLLDILGFEYDNTGDKAQEMRSAFKALGVQFKSIEDNMRSIEISNTPGRVHEIVEDLRRCAEQGRMSAKQWAKLQGRLHFVSSQLSGRVPRAMLRKVGLACEDSSATPARLAPLLYQLANFMENSTPRILSAISMGTVYVFTDASQEGSQGLDMGLGCVSYDDQGRLLSWFGTKIDRNQAAMLTQGKQKVINESPAVALSFPLLRQHIAGRHVVFYLDTEAARVTLLRMRSESPALELLAGMCGVLEAACPANPTRRMRQADSSSAVLTTVTASRTTWYMRNSSDH